MKHFWALPALFRPALVLAAHHAFSVNDDLLAFPQYEIRFSDEYVSARLAQSRIEEQEDHTGSPPDDGSRDSANVHIDRYHPDFSHHHHDGRTATEPKLVYEQMLLDGQRYLCAIPQVLSPADAAAAAGNDTAASASEQAKELGRATERGWELLAGMQDNCVYFISGWWSYRFCYKQGVKQFHQLPPARGVPVYPPVEDPGVEGFMLGSYKGEDAKEEKKRKTAKGQARKDGEVGQPAARMDIAARGELVAKGESRYLVQILEGGTVCDLTGKERRIEVQFHCNPSTGSDRITLIKETSTCAYLMVIHTPRLCNDVAFLPPQKDQPNDIVCQPVLEPHDTERYRHDLAAAKSHLRESERWQEEVRAAAAGGDAQDAEPVHIVGDIIVGGRSIVPEGVEIERSAIAGGGRYVDTVANSDGRMLAQAEMEKLGIEDLRAVEEIKKKLEMRAAGAKWKLVVVDTPNGREYRGIINGDEDEEDEEGGEHEGADAGAGDGDGDGSDRQEGSHEEYYTEEL